jgi:DNA repair protein RadA/Sms
MPASAVVIGEVGLAGDLRRVTGMERRLAEAARLGFTTALIPHGVKSVPAGICAMPAKTINGALALLEELAVKPVVETPKSDRPRWL